MARYSPGEWYAVVSPTGIALLPQTVPAGTLERVWEALRAGDGLGAVIEGLVGAFGTSLSSLPEFAVLSVSGDEVRVAARGAVGVELRREGGVESVSGAGVTTWSERVLQGVLEAVVTAPGAATTGPLLPIADGIVAAASVHLGVDDRTAPPAEVAHPPVRPRDLPEPPAPPAVPAAQADQGTYEQLLFGETVASSVEAAAVREPDPEAAPGAEQPVPAAPPAPPEAAPEPEPAPVAPPAPPVPGVISGIPPLNPVRPAAPAPGAGGATTLVPPPAGDHDGQTILGDELPPQPTPPVVAAAPAAPSIAEPPAQRRPPVLVAPGVPRVVLDRSAIVGTRPRLARVQGGNAPQLVTVHSPSGEVSRTHLELRVEGTTVLAVDLDSTNGTLLLRAGADPVRLHPGEPTMLVAGDRIDLGDGVILDFEGII